MSNIVAVNIAGQDLTLTQLPIPNGTIPAFSTVTLTDFASVEEIQADEELFSLIRNGSVSLEVNGLTLDQEESIAAVSTTVQTAAEFANYYNSSAYAGITTTASTLPFNATRGVSTSAFTLSSNQVTINLAGTYRVDYGCSSSESSGGDATVEVWMEVDKGSGFNELAGTRCRWFHDNVNEEGGNSGFAIESFGKDDVLRVRGQVVNGTEQIDTRADALRLAIQSVGANGIPGAQGEQGPAGSGSTLRIQDEGSNLANTPHQALNFTGAGVTASDAGGGVATINIPGGAAASANIAQYRNNANQTIATTATTVALNANDFQDSNYSRSGENITINTAGVYKISYSAYYDTTANARRTLEVWVEKNTSEIIPSRSAGYSRNQTDDTASVSATFMVELATNDVLRLRGQSTGTSGTLEMQANKVWICFEFMRT